MVLQSESGKSIQSPSIQSDLPCRQCGYNLRGLGAQGNCPECGMAVATSTEIQFIGSRNPRLARKLSRGAKAVIVGMIFCGVSPVVNWLRPGLIYNTRLSFALDGVDLAGSVMTLLGLWILTSRKCCPSEDWTRSWARKLIRLAAIIVPVFKATMMIITYGDVPWLYKTLDDPRIRTAYLSAVMIDCASRIAGTFAVLSFLRYLAWHIPRPRLATSFRFLEAAFGIPFAIMVLVEAADLIMISVPYPNDAKLMAILTWTSEIVRWPAALFYLTYVALLYRFSRMVCAHGRR